MFSPQGCCSSLIRVFLFTVALAFLASPSSAQDYLEVPGAERVAWPDRDAPQDKRLNSIRLNFAYVGYLLSPDRLYEPFLTPGTYHIYLPQFLDLHSAIELDKGVIRGVSFSKTDRDKLGMEFERLEKQAAEIIPIPKGARGITLIAAEAAQLVWWDVMLQPQIEKLKPKRCEYDLVKAVFEKRSSTNIHTNLGELITLMITEARQPSMKSRRRQMYDFLVRDLDLWRDQPFLQSLLSPGTINLDSIEDMGTKRFDGLTYELRFQRGDLNYSAFTVSPDPTSLTGKFVALLEDLSNACWAQRDADILTIAQKAQTLLNDVRTAYAKD